MTLDGRDRVSTSGTASKGTAQARLGQDRQLVDAILSKDRKAAAEFVELYADPLYAYVRARLAPRRDLVDDLVQDVFVSALGGLKGYAGQSSLRTWLLGIARHKVEDYYRSRLRQVDSFADSDADSDMTPDPTLELDTRLDLSKLRQKTRHVLTRLPEHYSVALLWRYWEKRTARQMAAQTGRTEKAIERLLARARASFKKVWEAS